MSDTPNDASGEVAEKRVRKPRVAKPRASEQSEIALPPAAPAAAAASRPAPAPAQPRSRPRSSARVRAGRRRRASSNAKVAASSRAMPAARTARTAASATATATAVANASRTAATASATASATAAWPTKAATARTSCRARTRRCPKASRTYSLGDLKRMPAHKLLEIADQLQISEGVARARKQDVIFALLKVLTRHGEGVPADGVLEILPDGFGFLRAAEASYLAGPDDTYISPVADPPLQPAHRRPRLRPHPLARRTASATSR